MKFVYLKAYLFSVKVICLILLHLVSSWCKLNKLVNKQLWILCVISQCYMPAASLLSVTQRIAAVLCSSCVRTLGHLGFPRAKTYGASLGYIPQFKLSKNIWPICTCKIYKNTVKIIRRMIRSKNTKQNNKQMLKSVLFTIICINFCHLLFTTIPEHREICMEVANENVDYGCSASGTKINGNTPLYERIAKLKFAVKCRKSVRRLAVD